jgi:hypothetical protein
MLNDEQERKSMGLEHQGDHHFAKVAMDEATKKVSAAYIQNFSENSVAAVQMVDGGNVEANFVHSGDTHSLRVNARPDGGFDGTFKDEQKGIEVSLSGGIAKLVKGQLPTGGLDINADHHKVSLRMGSEGKLSGIIESQRENGGGFRLSLTNGALSGSLIHKGGGHETELSLSKDSWGAKVAFGKGNGKFTFSVQGGKTEKKVIGGIKLNF